MFPLPELSCIPVVVLSSFHQAVGEKDIAVSGVPKLNRVETWEDVRAVLYMATFESLPLK